MGDIQGRRTPNFMLAHDQKCPTDDGYGVRDAVDLDEAVERSMRVYTPEEIMDLLTCGAPGRFASTERWQDFLVLMRRAPPTRASQRGIEEAERELAYRWSRHQTPGLLNDDNPLG